MCGNRISVRFLKTRTELNRSQKVKPKISVSVAFLKTELVSYKKSIFKPFSQSFNILHVTDTKQWHDWHHIDIYNDLN